MQKLSNVSGVTDAPQLMADDDDAVAPVFEGVKLILSDKSETGYEGVCKVEEGWYVAIAPAMPFTAVLYPTQDEADEAVEEPLPAWLVTAKGLLKRGKLSATNVAKAIKHAAGGIVPADAHIRMWLVARVVGSLTLKSVRMRTYAYCMAPHVLHCCSHG